MSNSAQSTAVEMSRPVPVTIERTVQPNFEPAAGRGATVANDNSSSNVINIAPGAIVVRTEDVDGFNRSSDQIARSLGDKIRRANRRNG